MRAAGRGARSIALEVLADGNLVFGRALAAMTYNGSTILVVAVAIVPPPDSTIHVAVRPLTDAPVELTVVTAT